MKILSLSDLHIEYGAYLHAIPEVDVICLNGDISLSCVLEERMTDPRSRKLRKRTRQFLEACCSKAKYVFWIPGNHEHYHGVYEKSIERMRSICDGLQVLCFDKGYVEVGNNTVFIGTTMWADFNKADPISMHVASQIMNDFNVIKHENGLRMRAEELLQIHYENKEWLRWHINKFSDEKIVVMTHHAPSHLSIHPAYKCDYYMNGAYTSDLTDLMAPNVKLWLHGHIHASQDYTVYDTRVVCNPRGYHAHELNPDFNPELILEV